MYILNDNSKKYLHSILYDYDSTPPFEVRNVLHTNVHHNPLQKGSKVHISLDMYMMNVIVFAKFLFSVELEAFNGRKVNIHHSKKSR